MNEIELIEELIEDFKALANDTDKWEWFIDIKDNGTVQMRLFLDNDTTYIEFPTHEDAEMLKFDGYIGSGEGICNLLDALSVNYEVA